MKNAQIIAVSNQKGGVCKTTSCFTIANVLADKGYSVLMVDMDPQSSLTVAAGIDQLKLKKCMYHVMMEDVHIEEIIVSVCDKENLYLAPSTIDLSAAELQLVNSMSRETILKQKLTKIKDDFDYILIDCSPSLGLLVINSLTAADGLVIPCSLDFLAYSGLALLLNTFEKVKALLNPNIKLLGVIGTLYDQRTLHCKEVLEILSKHFTVLGTVGISVKVKDAFLEHRCINDVAPKHQIAQDYIKITEAIING